MALQRMMHIAVCLRDMLRLKLCTPYIVLKLKAWGASIGKGNRFWGIPVIHLIPGSKLKIGNRCRFRSGKKDNYIGVMTPCIFSTLTKDAEIIIGNGCGMSATVIGAGKKIVIGNNVKVGANTVITDTDWHYEDTRSGRDADVYIGDNVWLGYGVVVLKGVTIGENSVIGARSVVTHDIPANMIAAGNPCKVIREIRQ